jgi:hypothetical protein
MHILWHHNMHQMMPYFIMYEQIEKTGDVAQFSTAKNVLRTRFFYSGSRPLTFSRACRYSLIRR